MMKAYKTPLKSMFFTRRKGLIGLLMVVAALAGSSMASTNVVFGTPSDIDDESDVLNDGAFVLAANVCGSAQTINGIDFSAFAGAGITSDSLTSNGVTITMLSDTGNASISSSTPPYDSAALKNLYDTGFVSGNGSAYYARIGLTNLVPGTWYRLQVLGAFQENQVSRDFVMYSGTDTLGSNFSATIDGDGVIGKSITATWQADAATQDFYLDSTGGRVFLQGTVLSIVSAPDYGTSIKIDSTSFSHVVDFDVLGTSDVAWDDGNTMEGVYLNSEGGTGIPVTVPDSTGGSSTANAYTMGLSGDSDRALGWITSSGSGKAYVGVQFENTSGEDVLTLSYEFVVEQWGERNTAAQDFPIQYKMQTSNGNNNTLISSSWTTLGTATTPVVGDGVAPYELNGNTNQMVVSGTFTVDYSTWPDGDPQFLTFRMVDVDHSGGDAMVGLDQFTLSVAANPMTSNSTTYAWLDDFYEGLSTEEEYENAARSDTDGDGHLAWQEFIAGTVPTNAVSVLAVSSAVPTADGCVVTWSSIAGKSYSLSTNLTLNSSWGVEESGITGLVDETSYTSSVDSAEAFFKVEVQ